MQQLQTLFWQRNGDITLLKQQQRVLKKQDFQERERMRIQRENWIIKIIKTMKILTSESKKNIYQCLLRMMAYYGEKESLSRKDDIDWDKNFTEQVINLFVAFYTECGQGDTSNIKKIVRPNNAFIVVDLIKQLVETHRQYFKVKLLETYKEAQKIIDQKAKIKQTSVLLPLRREIPTEPSEPDQYKKQPSIVDSIQLHGKISQVMLEKWQNWVNYSLPSQKDLKSQINDAYIELLQRNCQNKFMITKFQQKCFGKSRSFLYNVSSLYTQQQIKAMQSKIKYDISEKFSNIKQLRGNPSADQLKEYFKIKIQIQENYDKIQNKKINNKPINEWVPLVVQKSGLQSNPLNVYLLFVKELIEIDDMQIKCGISLKNYMRMIIRNKIQESNKQIADNEFKNFKRHHFIDLNHAKKKQLMIDQHRVYEKSKKQSIFPMLRSNQLRQESEIALKNRSLSEYKLAPLFKNDMISRKFQFLDTEQQPDQDQNPSIQLLRLQPIEKSMQLPISRSTSKLNVSSEHKQGKEKQKQKQKDHWIKFKLKDINSSSRKKSKIDNIIELIINQRNLTVTN